MKRSFLSAMITSFFLVSLLVVFAPASTAQLKDIEGLVAYYNFDNGSMDDMSGNGHDGKLVGAAKFVETDGAPIENGNGCVEFSKENGNAVDAGPGEKIENNITLMAWAKAPDVNATQYIAGMPYDDGDAWDSPWIGYHIGVRGGKMATWFNIAGVDAEYDSGTVEANEWTHLCFTWDGKNSMSYVNGEEVAKKARPGEAIKFEGEPHFVIGERSHTATGEPFGGLIDEVALFDRVLTPAEIKQAMNGGIFLSVQYRGKLATTWGNIKR